MTKYRLTTKQSESTRESIMIATSIAYEAAEKDSDAWIELSEIKSSRGSLPAYPGAVATSLLRLGLIETKKDGGKKFVKITQYGLQIVGRGKGEYTYGKLQRSLQLPINIYDRLEEISTRLGVTRGAGRGAGVSASIVALMNAVVVKSDAFERWFKAVYPEEAK